MQSPHPYVNQPNERNQMHSVSAPLLSIQYWRELFIHREYKIAAEWMDEGKCAQNERFFSVVMERKGAAEETLNAPSLSGNTEFINATPVDTKQLRPRRDAYERTAEWPKVSLFVSNSLRQLVRNCFLNRLSSKISKLIF